MKQTIWNRPARIDAMYEGTQIAKVRWLDNNTLGYVPLDEVEQ